jgi:hypothetical protein
MDAGIVRSGNIGFSAYLSRSGRADERTHTTGPISLRVRFGFLYPSRKVAYIQRKVSAAYRPVTLGVAQDSVPVSVSL